MSSRRTLGTPPKPVHATRRPTDESTLATSRQDGASVATVVFVGRVAVLHSVMIASRAFPARLKKLRIRFDLDAMLVADITFDMTQRKINAG
jgi:hypothetical protein